MRNQAVIRIVDDEASTRSALEFMLQAEGWTTRSYPSAAAYLTGDSPSDPGCVILDIRMDEMDGMELQQEMNRRGIRTPVIFFSAHGTIELAVQGMQAGASNFLTKTVDRAKLLAAVAKAVEEDSAHRPQQLRPSDYIHLYETLTDREKEIAKLTAEGLLTRDIADRLGIAPKTARAFRGSIYHKLNCTTTNEIAGFIEHLRTITEL